MKKYLSLLLVALMTVTVLFVSISCSQEQSQQEQKQQVVQYTVTFQTNGGTPKLDPVTVNDGTTISKTKKVVTKEGYTLVGWYTDAEFKTQFILGTTTKGTKVTSDLTLYAKWVDTTTYEHSDPILPAGSVALNNYTFEIPLTWSADSDGYSTKYPDSALPAVTYSFSGERTSATNVSPELVAAVKNTPQSFFDETPTNVIFLFSDGWGVTEVNMSREYKGELIMDSLPYATESKTDSYKKFGYDYNALKDYTTNKTTDSPAGGTQVLAGYKTRYGYISLDVDGNKVPNLFEAAKSQGWKTAVVTNDNIVDATPAVAMIHDTLREHSDVLYFKALKYALKDKDLDLLMGWDWGMGTYYANSDWATKLLSAEKEGIKDAVDEYDDVPSQGTKTPIEYFTDLSTELKAKVAPFSMYYTLWENQDSSRHNSFMRWTSTGASELAAYLTWLGDGGETSGLGQAIAELDATFANPASFVPRFTTFKSLVENTDFSKPILGSWTKDGNDYKSSAPNRGYLLNGSIGKSYPSWPEMVAYTIYQLDKEADQAETGFFCLIENTCTDGWGHSSNQETKVYGMMNEVQCFDEGVAIAVKYVLEHPDTLLVISADHETGDFRLLTGWETDYAKIYSNDTGHSSQRVPLYAFGAGAQNFSAASIYAKYGSQANASVSEGGKVHEGWITGALMGELITGAAFGQPSDYNGKPFTSEIAPKPHYGNDLWNPAKPVWVAAAD